MATEYTFFSSSHGTVNKTDYLLSQETHLNQLKRTDVMPNTLSDHHRIKININTEKELSTTCFQNIQDKQNTLNQHSQRNLWEAFKHFQLNNNEHRTYWNVWGVVRAV